jgi:hypothetical protein
MRAFVLTFVVLLVQAGVTHAQDPAPEPTQNPSAAFRLFRSQNIYTFLMLDTRTGQIWQMQWSMDANRYVAPLNRKPLVEDGKPGRFTLYPTRNIFTFILLDQDTGKSWQVQWGREENRVVIPIE